MGQNRIMENEKLNAWILTHSGKHFNPFIPKAENVDIEDIAFSLSNLCRFTGHCKQFYSVASHSVITMLILEDEFPSASKKVRRAALLHDAHEAYVNDLASPVKRHLPAYGELCDRVQEIIDRKFDIVLTADERAMVEKADLLALATEASVLLPNTNGWNLPVGPSKRGLEALETGIDTITHKGMKDIFLAAFKLVSGGSEF